MDSHHVVAAAVSPSRGSRGAGRSRSSRCGVVCGGEGRTKPSGSGIPSAASLILRNYQQIGSKLARQGQECASATLLHHHSRLFNARLNIRSTFQPRLTTAPCTGTRLPTSLPSHSGNFNSLVFVAQPPQSLEAEPVGPSFIASPTQPAQCVEFSDAPQICPGRPSSRAVPLPTDVTSFPPGRGGSSFAGKGCPRQ